MGLLKRIFKNRQKKEVSVDKKNEAEMQPAKAVAVEKTKVKKIQKTAGRARNILVRPLVTEKTNFMGSENKYVFAVSQDANKLELLKAIKELYGVMPVKVNIINTKGKQTRHGQTKGKQKDWKRAVITLKQGEKIEEYKGVQNIH